jgi:hypothetical protein
LLFSILIIRISIGYALEATLAGMFLAAITPSSAGGERCGSKCSWIRVRVSVVAKVMKDDTKGAFILIAGENR